MSAVSKLSCVRMRPARFGIQLSTLAVVLISCKAVIFSSTTKSGGMSLEGRRFGGSTRLGKQQINCSSLLLCFVLNDWFQLYSIRHSWCWISLGGFQVNISLHSHITCGFYPLLKLLPCYPSMHHYIVYDR